MYKNIEQQQKVILKDLVDEQPGQIVSKTLVQNDKVSMTLFSLTRAKKLQRILLRRCNGNSLEGTGKFTVGGEEFILEAGETLVMPRNVPHAVYGIKRFKMQLTVSF